MHRTCPEPISNRFYSMEVTGWYLIALHLFSILPSHVNEKSWMSWRPGDSVEEMELGHDGYEKLLSRRMKSVVDFAQGKDCYASLLVICNAGSNIAFSDGLGRLLRAHPAYSSCISDTIFREAFPRCVFNGLPSRYSVIEVMLFPNQYFLYAEIPLRAKHELGSD